LKPETTLKNIRCLLITPTRNEELHIEKTILSMISQTTRPTKWVIVNDGSTDSTPAIIDKYVAAHSWIERYDMPSHRERSFAAKANNFNTACKVFNSLEYDVIGNIDSDVAFEQDFLEFLLNKFVEMPALGVAGTPFVEEGGYDSALDSFEGEFYVPGQFQLFRRECLADIGGYVANKAGGLDWMAVTTARFKGWKTRSFREKRFFHHRSLGTAERGPLEALYSYGEKDYYLGGSPIWQIFRVGYRISKRPYVFGGLALGLGYISAAIRRIDRPISAELMQFHRREQMKKLRLILGRLVTLKKLDNFSVLTPSETSPKGPAPRT
jgi:glycosyltransferase involved in cell wall biosynthesis